jgi:hypothetical protein
VALVLGVVGVYVYTTAGERAAHARQTAQQKGNIDDTTANTHTAPDNSSSTVQDKLTEPQKTTPTTPVSSKSTSKDQPRTKNKNASVGNPKEKGNGQGKNAAAENNPVTTVSPQPAFKPYQDPGPASNAALLKLPRSLRTATFAPPAAAMQVVDRSRHKLKLTVPARSVHYFQPPPRPDNDDSFIVYASPDAAAAAGRQWVLEQISPVGTRVAQLAWEADDWPYPRLAISKSKDQLRLFAVVRDRVRVWDLTSKSVIRDQFDPFAGNAEAQSAGIAALYATDDPHTIIAVASSGVIIVYDLSEEKIVQSFRPAQAQPGRVHYRTATAADSDHRTFVVAVGGTLFHFRCDANLTPLAQIPLGGDVHRSLAIAVEGERIVYVLETGDASQRERAILLTTHQGAAAHRLLRWPRDVGEPTAAAWSEATAVISTTRGGLLLEYDEGNLVPFAYVYAANNAPPFLATQGSYLWYLLPDPDQPQTQTVAASLLLPPEQYTQWAELFANKQPLPRLLLTPEGLKK